MCGEVRKVFAGIFQKAAGVSGAEPTSRDRGRGISPERAEQARSGLMRSETQEGKPEISPVDCFGPGEPSSGVPPAGCQLAGTPQPGKGRGENPAGVCLALPSFARQITPLPKIAKAFTPANTPAQAAALCPPCSCKARTASKVSAPFRGRRLSPRKGFLRCRGVAADSL